MHPPLLIVLLSAVLVIPSSSAQPPTEDGRFLIEWRTPAGPTPRVMLDENGSANATFRVGYELPARSGSCVGGAMIEVPIRPLGGPNWSHQLLEPGSVVLPQDHLPSTGSPSVRWSTDVVFSIQWYLDRADADTYAYELRTGTPIVSGGMCTPRAVFTIQAATSDILVARAAHANSTAPLLDQADASPTPGLGGVPAFLLVAGAAWGFMRRIRGRA